MEKMKVLYKNKDDVCIVQLPGDKYFYGNGKTFGGIGVSPNQFLRFNPYLDYVAEDNIEVPEAIMEWLDKNK